MINSRLPMLLARRALVEQARTQIRSSSHGNPGGMVYRVRGANLPFKTNNPRILYLKFLVYMAIPYWLPYVVIRHQLLKSAA